MTLRSGLPEAAQRVAALTRELRSYHADPEVFAALRRFKQAGGAADPVVNRQLALWPGFISCYAAGAR